MRRRVIAGNWKMYKTIADTRAFFVAFSPMVADANYCDIVIAPPFPDIPAAVESLESVVNAAPEFVHARRDLARAYHAAGRAASALDSKDADATMLCAMAKRFGTDVGFEVANQALQLHGGYGYLSEYGIEKIVRDLRVHQILEGTNEIMRLIVARKLIEGAR